MIRCRMVSIGIIMLLIASNTFAAGKIMSVQIQTGEIRSLPSPLATVVASVKYGDRLTVLEEKGMWTKVTTADSNASGWIHSSALTKQKLTLAAAGKDAQTGASGGEMALAGKGFTPQVEAQYKAKHSDIDFTWIDKMVKTKVSTQEIMDFMKEGNIALPEGGAK
jgi:uncharacterized protein YgiM (DUF1202 family)